MATLRPQKNRPGKLLKAGITLSPACLAIYFTWLQAGRLKSPRDKSCSYSPPRFPSRRPSDMAVKSLICAHDPEKWVPVSRLREALERTVREARCFGGRTQVRKSSRANNRLKHDGAHPNTIVL